MISAVPEQDEHFVFFLVRMQCIEMQYNTLQYNAMLLVYNDMQKMQCKAMQYFLMQILKKKKKRLNYPESRQTV